MLIERAIRIFIFVLNIIIFTFLLCICLPELFLLSLKNSILKRLICLNFLFTLVQYIYSIKIILILLYSDWLKVFYLIIFSFLNFSIIKFIFNGFYCSRMLKISKQINFYITSCIICTRQFRIINILNSVRTGILVVKNPRSIHAP